VSGRIDQRHPTPACRYWRVRRSGGTVIVMDAPPEMEDCGRYVRIARKLRAISLNLPGFLPGSAAGFLLIGDLGERLLTLDEASVERLYGDALAAGGDPACGPAEGLPIYDGPFCSGARHLSGGSSGITWPDLTPEKGPSSRVPSIVCANAWSSPRSVSIVISTHAT
jgi:hypothetical protein